MVGFAAAFVALVEACADDASTPTGDLGGDTAPDGAAPDVSVAASATVRGQIVDPVGRPVVGAQVRIAMSSVATDDQGRFALEAPATYDLVVVHPSTDTTTNKETTTLVGLTTRSLVLETGMFEPSRHAGDVSLDVAVADGGAIADSYQLAFVSESDAGVESFAGAVATSALPVVFSGTLAWYGEPANHGTLHVLGVTQTGAFPSGFTAAGTAAYTLEAAQPSALHVDVAPVASARIAGTIAPGPTTLASLMYALQPDGTHSFLRWVSVADLPATIDLPMPNVRGYTAIVQASFAYGDGESRANVWRANLTPNTTDIVLAAPPGITAEKPVSGASSIDLATASFGWRAATGGVSVLDVRCPPVSATVPAPAYHASIITTKSDAALFETGSLGLPIPTGTTCAWTVGALPRVVDTDAFLRDGGLRRLARAGGAAPVDGIYVFTASRLFSTK